MSGYRWIGCVGGRFNQITVARTDTKEWQLSKGKVVRRNDVRYSNNPIAIIQTLNWKTIDKKNNPIRRQRERRVPTLI